VAPPTGATVEGEEKIPRSFVFKHRKVGQYVQQLILELRQMMAPYTALKLKERKKNSIKDYLNVSGQFGVTHFLILSQTDNNVNLKIARTPQGPTLSFKVLKYSLGKGIVSLQRRPYGPQVVYQTPPLVVLNNFADATEAHVKLMRVTFQNMFPPINVQTIKLTDCRRVVLFHFIKEDQTVEVRHYSIRAVPTGISRSVKRVVQAKLPNLGRLEDVSEFLEGYGGGNASDSEAEDEGSHVVLSQKYRGRGNTKSQKSSIRLSELGPRITIQLQKVEKDLCEGDVMYHGFVTKTKEEAAALKAKKEEQLRQKKRRREEQEANVARKKAAIEEKRQKKQQKRKAKEEQKHEEVEEGEDDDESTTNRDHTESHPKKEFTDAKDGDDSSDEDEDIDSADEFLS